MNELNGFALDKKGEVIIYDLAQAVQAYLHKHNKAPVGSFYEQMLKEKLRKEEARNQQYAQKLSKEQQVLRDEVLKRQEILKNEGKYRRDTRRSMSESSPTHRNSSSSEISEVAGGIFRDRIYPNYCTMHQNSDDLYFSSVGRKIRRGCCLGRL